jgi:hypothetical protein
MNPLIMIKKITYINCLCIFSILVLLISCVDEIPLETESFESVLVVEATITNEDIQHEILLSRSSMFDSLPIQESGATIVVTDDAMNSYTFSQVSPGKYLSQASFAAQPNRNYTLSINTIDGKQYESSKMQLTQPTSIDDLYVERDFNENGVEGVSIYVDSYDPTNSSKFYRHEYEETYKIIVPFYSPLEMISNEVEFPIPVDEQPQWDTIQELVDFVVTTQFRPEQEKICYNTIKSNSILLASTVDFLEDRLEKHRVRFLARDNTNISHRYSILVRQYVQSIEAHTYYETLKTQSISETVFSETQPGFIVGNMFSKNSTDERVIGFFEVVSADEKRVYFNYSDLFVDEDLPPYYISCGDFIIPDVIKVDLLTGTWLSSPLADDVKYRNHQYFDENVGGSVPYRLVFDICGDCTFLGENIVPDFWEE